MNECEKIEKLITKSLQTLNDSTATNEQKIFKVMEMESEVSHTQIFKSPCIYLFLIRCKTIASRRR